MLVQTMTAIGYNLWLSTKGCANVIQMNGLKLWKNLFVKLFGTDSFVALKCVEKWPYMTDISLSFLPVSQPVWGSLLKHSHFCTHVIPRFKTQTILYVNRAREEGRKCQSYPVILRILAWLLIKGFQSNIMIFWFGLLVRLYVTVNPLTPMFLI